LRIFFNLELSLSQSEHWCQRTILEVGPVASAHNLLCRALDAGVREWEIIRY
jgi:hypothetical protein